MATPATPQGAQGQCGGSAALMELENDREKTLGGFRRATSGSEIGDGCWQNSLRDSIFDHHFVILSVCSHPRTSRAALMGDSHGRVEVLNLGVE